MPCGTDTNSANGKFHRQETKQIPHIVVAPKAGPQLPPELETDRSIYETGVGDARGYYQDGAYTAAPELLSPPPDEGSWRDDDQDPVKKHAALVESYCTSLLSRYTALRDILQTDPPQSAIDSLPREHETEVDSFGPRSHTFKQWEHRLRYTDPLPAQIAAMDKVSVLRLLRVILGGKFLRRGYTLRERTSRWIWALLARLPDRGELDSIEIGWVRDLGKRAVAVSINREHARALSQIVDRAQLEAFGLRSVLTEIDEEDEEEEEHEEELGEMVPAEEEGEVVDEDKPRANSSSPMREEPDEKDSTGQVQPQEVAYKNSEEISMDQEDGEVDEAEAPQPQPEAEQSKEAESDMEDGEIADDPPTNNSEGDLNNAIVAAKARLLASLESTETWEAPSASATEQHVSDPMAEKFNMRTTVNMILTVAGEFYGQRDLLQFRAPFAEL